MFINCSFCDKIFQTQPYKVKKHKNLFCSTSCQHAFRNKKLNLICSVCETPYSIQEYRVKSQISTYCSKKCANKALIKERIEKVCEQCGETFYFLESRLKHSSCRFCSDKCRKTFINENGVPHRRTDNFHFFRSFPRKNACSICDFEGKTDIHHIDGDRTNNTKENFLEVCKKCHMTIHGISIRHECSLIDALKCYRHTIDLPRGEGLKNQAVQETALAEHLFLQDQ